MNIKESITSQAREIGIDIIGFTACDPFESIRDILIIRGQKGYLSGFEENDIEKRVNPGYLLENCQTIISVGVSYNIEIKNKYSEGNRDFKCNISRSSWGQDYHNVLRGMLTKLGEFINEKYGAQFRVFTDTGPLPEREIARRAGIGFIGKNGFVINPEYGSFIFLGELITTLYIEPDNPIDDRCGECNLCINACPSGALIEPLMLNAKECISYITQSRDINSNQHKKIGSSVYGCDICQNVCPFNRKALLSKHMEFMPEDWNIYPDIMDILKMDNKKYNETFKRTSSGWRGKKLLQRNAIIALGNSGNKSAAQYIANTLSDSRPDIREVCVYALLSLLGDECRNILSKHVKIEKNQDIINIINSIIYRMQL